MYNPYTNFSCRFFPGAITVVDSFHVISWLIQSLQDHIRIIRKRYVVRDRKALEESNYKKNSAYKTKKKSREVYILDKYKLALLKNDDDLYYSEKTFYETRLCGHYNTESIIKVFLELDIHFKPLRNYKEMYVKFNKRNLGHLESAEKELDEIINEFKTATEYRIRDFSKLLIKYRKEIINSFSIVTSVDHEGNEIIRRISNGPMEGYNRIPKSYKRDTRGIRNFEFARLRLMWADNPDAAILGVPKTIKEIR